MSKLDELIEELCPDGVRREKLGLLCEIKTGKGLKQKECIEDGKYPVISGGKTPMGYYSEYNREANNVTISRVGANAGFVLFITERFYVNDKCFAVIPYKEDVILTKFLYYCLKNIERDIISLQSQGGVPTINTKKVSNIEIFIPPLEVQEEIVRILDSLTEYKEELTTKLTAELTARKKQYEYYKENILDLKSIQHIPLKNILLKINSINWNKCIDDKKYIDLSSVNRENNSVIEEDVKDVNYSNAPSRAKQIILENDILFGTTRPMLKRKYVVEKKYNNQICSTGFCVLRVDESKALFKYVYHCLGTSKFYKYIENNQQGASYPAISDKILKEYCIPIPTIKQQEYMVSILDRFEILCNDISQGIPAEIEARQKQYEYYRDKLLTFKELV